MPAPPGGPGSLEGKEGHGRARRSCGAERWCSLGTLAKGAEGPKPTWFSASEATSTPAWSTSATRRPRGTRGTPGRLRGPADAPRGASTRNESTRGTSSFKAGMQHRDLNYVRGIERRSEQRWFGARQTVRCVSTEPVKPCNPATTHTLSRTLDRNTTKRNPQRHAARLVVHEEASSGAESAPLGVKDNGWNKHRPLCESVPKLYQKCIHPPTTQLLGTDGCGLEEKWH